MGRLLKTKYGLWPPANLFSMDLAMGLHYYHNNGDFSADRVDALQRLSKNEKQKVRLVQGHMGFGIHEYFPQQCQYVTVIREPVNRVLSHYHQLKLQDWCPFKEEIRSMPMKDFLVQYPIDAFSNYQVKMLAGVHKHLPGDATPYDLTSANRNTLETAQRNVAERYLTIVTESFDESLLLMKEQLGWRHAHYIKSNVTKKRRKREDLDDSVIELIRSQNSLDIELYGQVVEKMKIDIANQGPDFQQKVKKFKKRNRFLNRVFYWPIDRLFKLGRKVHVSRRRHGVSTATKSKLL